MATNVILHPLAYPNTPYVSWIVAGIEQVVSFANADDAKTCWQVLSSNGFCASFHIPQGYKEIPYRHYEGDGLLSDEELARLQKEIANMVLVGG